MQGCIIQTLFFVFRFPNTVFLSTKNIKNAYFDQYLGAAHSKYWLKYTPAGVGNHCIIQTLFFVFRFPNTVCSGTSYNGTCYSSTECSQLGGSSSGTCAAGYGVCCICKSFDCYSLNIHPSDHPLFCHVFNS